LFTLGEVNQDEPRVGDVVVVALKVVVDYVVLAYFDIRLVHPREEPRVDVGDDDAALRADPIAEPACD